jgi:glycosyltransferase involved in cell wall biosynthesis
MRITFCAYDQPDYINGPNVWLSRLCGQLVARGSRPRVLLLERRGPGPTSRMLADAGVEIERVECQRFTEQRVRWILERVAESPPDVFVPNLAVPAYFAARWIRAAGIPTIGVLHSDDAFHWGLVDEFVGGPEPFRLSALVCVSRFLAEELAALAPCEVRVTRIPYGVAEAPKAAAWSGSSLRIAYVGRLVRHQKRVREVALALCRAAEELPGVEGVLFGEGPERKWLEAFLRRRPRCAVRLAGRVSTDDLLSALPDCQALALLSDYEGLPISVLEAMACGVVPICLASRSGVGELVEDGTTGLLVTDRADSFVSAVRRLRSDSTLWRHLSDGARERASVDYSLEQNLAGWLALCREVSSSTGPRRSLEAPKALDLPPVHRHLAREDQRDLPFWPSLLDRGRRRAERIAERFRPALPRRYPTTVGGGGSSRASRDTTRGD